MPTPAYVQITQQEAKQRMDTEEVLVLDVSKGLKQRSTILPAAARSPETIPEQPEPPMSCGQILIRL